MVALWEVSLGIIVVILAALYFVFATFAVGAGYQPTFRRVVGRMLELAEVGPSDTVYDPGAGTGAIVFRAARERGARVVGIEIEPVRVGILRLRRALGPARDRVRIDWGNIFRTDYRPATVVAVFLWPEAMRRLEPILRAELAPGTRVVSHWHEVPGWSPAAVDEALRVYLYRVPPGPSTPAPRGPTGGR